MPVSKVNAALGAIEKRCGALCEKMGYELVEVAFERENTGCYLRIYLDKDGGITLDDCEAYHRAIQPQLEQEEYDFLEVCSPGLDRPIRNERDAQRHLGETVEIKLYKPQNGTKLFSGVFAGMQDGAYVLETPQGMLTFDKKCVAVARPVPDLQGIQDVELS